MNTGNNVVIKNSTVACRLDVYNDATSNYQWYNYRTAGMVVADVRDNHTVDGRTEANPERVTCENVKVIFGDWANYHYCESASYGTPSYAGEGEYKFKRVEAGLGYGGVDISACNHAANETHNELIKFDFLFGARDGKGIYGVSSFEGVTVDYEVNYEEPSLPTVDATKPVEKVGVGTTEEAKDVLAETFQSVVDAVVKGEEVKNVAEEVVVAIQNIKAEGKVINGSMTVEAKPVEKKDIDQADVKLVEKTSDGLTVVQYLDLSVLMTVKAEGQADVTGEVKELADEVTFVIALPKDLNAVKDGYTREYYVIRVHEGKTDKLPVTVNADGTLSFKTDRFSTYALAYTDTEAPKTETPKVPYVPKTADTNMLWSWMAVMAVAAAGAVAFKRREN